MAGRILNRRESREQADQAAQPEALASDTKPAAAGKLADLLARGKGLDYLQIVKGPMPEPTPAEFPGCRMAPGRN